MTDTTDVRGANDLSNTEYSFGAKQALIGAQMLFVAFGALVLVPLLTGLDPSVALFTAGLGTLIFQITTRGKVPVFLASSFAFIAPIIYGVQTWGMAATTGGLAAAGLLYVALSFAIRIFGSDFLHKLLPPVVVGPVIMVIGLSLAPVAVNMSTGVAGDAQIVPKGIALILAAVSLGATMITAILGRGIMRVVPIIVGVIAGYVTALIIGAITGESLINTAPLAGAAWFAVPGFVAPEFNLAAILFILPVAIAPAIEHFGDILAIGSVTKKDYIENPGIQNTMLGDGLATTAAGLLGGPPNTTYSEVTGAVTLTRAFNPAIMTWAAIFAIALSFVGKLGGALGTIPMPVMGGIMILLFGMVTVVGLTVLIRLGDHLQDARNMVIVSTVLIIGIGGLTLEFGDGFTLAGIGLSGVAGLVLNLFLPRQKPE
ncbi:Uracil permease [Aliiroseovarius sp. xm-m-379]|uniref:Uracil transporter n=1 Tax=Aliiroseovarius crassostreae TaxID=154981 RepID=A0A0N8IB04_9RHOB|nr:MULTISPECIES: uracil-xanthine permease family protein [Aliiroseovarius]KPN61755.1 uracil transporter [Aliiroseovarius crassostreae]NRP13618.1 Uracil permease [Aliiroseovarius sp. xm-d-517]NRP25010.1 Uracil permease [Aliiroseovarius sp. xm-m-379]NRP31469.1 Uracil permease [Aliiroseovarius sp. xm-m-314]NRP33809.1 Uracil permease [Aliiroseovarius sp. xm-a-104]